MKSSSSDNKSYPQFCEVAANDSKIFDEFRNNPIYKGVVETVSESDGLDYLNKAFKLNPRLKDSLLKLNPSTSWKTSFSYPSNSLFFLRAIYV